MVAERAATERAVTPRMGAEKGIAGMLRSSIVCGAVLIIAAVGAGPAAAAASLSPAGTASVSRPAVEVCGVGRALVRPRSVVITCADHGEIAEDLRWSSWTGTRAAAAGTLTWRACSADCALSRQWDRAAADITLNRPVREPGKGVLFTRLDLHVTGPTPPGFMRNLVYNETPMSAVLAPPPARRPSTGRPLQPSAAPSGTLGYAQIEGFWIDAGGPSGRDTSDAGGTYTYAQVAAAITGAESSFEPGAIQPDVDYCTLVDGSPGPNSAGWGLWQITCGNEVPQYGTDYQLLDPWNNAEAAVDLYDQNGFLPWSTYTQNKYEAHLQDTAADTALTDPGEYTQTLSPPPPGTPASPAADPGGIYGPLLNGGTPDAGLDSMFNSYGDNATCADWSGGDATNSVALPDGDRAWFFSDTFLGSPAARLTLFDASTIHNSIVIQNGSGLAQTITGGNTCEETNTNLSFWDRYAKTPAEAPDASSGGFYWTGDQMVDGSNVVKFYYHGDPVPGGLFEIDSPAVATIPVSSLEGGGSVMTISPTEFSCGSVPSDIIWGSALLSWGGYIYVYGWDASGAAGTDNYYLAETTAANLADPATWAIYDGLNSSGQPIWNSCLGDASPLNITKGAGISVASINKTLWLIQEDTTGLAGGPIAAHPSATPWGFTNSRIVLYNPPEATHAYPYYYLTYEARLQAGLTADSGADVVLSYNVNSTAVDTGCIGADVHDADIYRPRFIDVPIYDFQAEAAVPYSSSVTSSQESAVGIENAGGAAFEGDTGSTTGAPLAAMMRAAIRGGTPAARTAITNQSIGGVTDWYDYWATLTCPKIDAPGPLTITAHPDGTVDMSWKTVGTDVWYWGYQCDLTAGPCDSSTGSGFSKMWGGLWAESGSAGALPVTNSEMNGDSFEWYIRSFGAGNGNGGGNSPTTAPTAVTIAKPDAPTGLTASNTDQGEAGAVTLSWNTVTYPSTAVYYTPYYCDTETSSCSTTSDFTPAAATLLTIAQVLDLSPGVYDFYVTAENLGGTSPPSNEVTIAASTS
jgi:hypothetical protein